MNKNSRLTRVKWIFLIVVVLAIGIYFQKSRGINLFSILSSDEQVNPSQDIGNTGAISEEYCKNDPAVNIRDENNKYVQEAKRAILAETSITEKYFDTHFKFICGVDQPSKRAVVFIYSIGEYSLAAGIGLPIPQANINGYIPYAGITEINKVIPKQQAINSMRTCIGEYTQVYPIQFSKSGLYLYASNTKFSGLVNLENGMCKKNKISKDIF